MNIYIRLLHFESERTISLTAMYTYIIRSLCSKPSCIFGLEAKSIVLDVSVHEPAIVEVHRLHAHEAGSRAYTVTTASGQTGIKLKNTDCDLTI